MIVDCPAGMFPAGLIWFKYRKVDTVKCKECGKECDQHQSEECPACWFEEQAQIEHARMMHDPKRDILDRVDTKCMGASFRRIPGVYGIASGATMAEKASILGDSPIGSIEEWWRCEMVI